jgi:Rrf2 family protein
MKGFDAKTRYALLASLDLARHSAVGKPAKIREIAARTGIPPKYLVHILLQLKRRALANSTRGAKGGYWLLRPAETISAAEVIAAVSSDGGRAFRKPVQAAGDGAISRLWAEAQRRRDEFLARTTLAKLLAP